MCDIRFGSLYIEIKDFKRWACLKFDVVMEVQRISVSRFFRTIRSKEPAQNDLADFLRHGVIT